MTALRNPRDQPIEIDITADGRLQISVGLDLLRHAIENRDDVTLRVRDLGVMVRDMIRVLEADTSYSGLTPVQEMLDKAALDAYESGSEGFHA